jgi:uncharacterized protein (UPF0548 family)
LILGEPSPETHTLQLSSSAIVDAMITVMFRVRRPTDAWLHELARRSAADALSYGEPGLQVATSTPDGYVRRHWDRTIGESIEEFDRAVAGLKSWTAHRAAGLSVAADGPISVGTTAALAVPIFVGYAIGKCRVVAVVEADRRWGFTYGTLAVHPEQGEERFEVMLDDTDKVTFSIDSISRPHTRLVRLAGPIATRMQDRICRAYLDGLSHAARRR